MAVSEQQRHHFYTVAESVFGTEGAATLMEYLPPTGWADVARKSDITALKGDMVSLEARSLERMDSFEARSLERMVSFEARLSERIDSQGNLLRAEFYKSQEAQTRLIIFSMVSALLVVAALAFGAAKLV